MEDKLAVAAFADEALDSDDKPASDSGDESTAVEDGQDADGALEFGSELPKKVTGRRAKREREAKKKLRAGTFGEKLVVN
jgi:hypothetical protein